MERFRRGVKLEDERGEGGYRYDEEEARTNERGTKGKRERMRRSGCRRRDRRGRGIRVVTVRV